ncbi:hypothetical protein N9W34_00365 [Rickettsiales bacterium]|nr:hypothetical protein [Rickettsiales bacterium]
MESDHIMDDEVENGNQLLVNMPDIENYIIEYTPRKSSTMVNFFHAGLTNVE